MNSSADIKTIVILSGGVDSTVALWDCVIKRLPTKAISFDYSQRHRRELDSARQVANLAGVEHEVLTLPGWGDLMSSSALTGDVKVPLGGHYSDPIQKATVVPNRNMVFIALATSWAMSIGYERVAIGAHLGDRDIYLDCRSEFIESMGTSVSLSDDRGVEVWAPYIDWFKGDIVKHGISIGAPLDLTWTCYEGGVSPCGLCGACIERLEAFDAAK